MKVFQPYLAKDDILNRMDFGIDEKQEGTKTKPSQLSLLETDLISSTFEQQPNQNTILDGNFIPNGKPKIEKTPKIFVENFSYYFKKYCDDDC